MNSRLYLTLTMAVNMDEACKLNILRVTANVVTPVFIPQNTL